MNPIGHSPKNKQKKRSNISTTTSDSNCVDFSGMKSDIGTTSITRTKKKKKKKKNKRWRDDNNNDETKNKQKKNNEQMTRHSRKRRHEHEHKIMSSQTNNNHSPGIHDDTNHNNNSSNHRHSKKRKKNKSSSSSDKLLEGLVLSISTDSIRNNSNQIMTRTNTSTDLLTYKQACAMAQELGATISAQVHNKVHAVLCHVPSSCDSSNHHVLSVVTQRMKKALKKSIPIWDLQWLVEIYKCRQWMDPKSFIVTPAVQELWLQQEQQQQQQQQDQNGKNCGRTEVDVEYESEEELLNSVEKGWSEPISLDCCCVCHDDDRDDCPWCCQGDTKCNVFLKKKEQEKKLGSA